MAEDEAAETKEFAWCNLENTQNDLADVKRNLDVSSACCMQVAQDYQATVASRATELQALAEAKKIFMTSTAGAVGQTYSRLRYPLLRKC